MAYTPFLKHAPLIEARAPVGHALRTWAAWTISRESCIPDVAALFRWSGVSPDPGRLPPQEKNPVGRLPPTTSHLKIIGNLRHMLLRLTKADEGFDQCTSPKCAYSRVQIPCPQTNMCMPTANAQTWTDLQILMTCLVESVLVFAVGMLKDLRDKRSALGRHTGLLCRLGRCTPSTGSRAFARSWTRSSLAV